MAAFTSNIDITSGGTYGMNITNGMPASQVANDLNGKFANIQRYLQNGLPEVWTGDTLPDSLPNGKLIYNSNKLYSVFNGLIKQIPDISSTSITSVVGTRTISGNYISNVSTYSGTINTTGGITQEYNNCLFAANYVKSSSLSLTFTEQRSSAYHYHSSIVGLSVYFYSNETGTKTNTYNQSLTMTMQDTLSYTLTIPTSITINSTEGAMSWLKKSCNFEATYEYYLILLNVA